MLFLFRLSWGLQTPLDLMQKVYGDRMRQKAILVAMNGGSASQPWRPMGPMGRGCWSQAMGWFHLSGKPIGEWSLPREGQMDEGQKWNTQKKSCKTNLPGLDMFLILDLQPTCGMTRHGSKLSRPKLDTQILNTWHPILGCHWRNAEIQKLSLFTQLIGITIFAR